MCVYSTSEQLLLTETKCCGAESHETQSLGRRIEPWNPKPPSTLLQPFTSCQLKSTTDLINTNPRGHDENSTSTIQNVPYVIKKKNCLSGQMMPVFTQHGSTRNPEYIYWNAVKYSKCPSKYRKNTKKNCNLLRYQCTHVLYITLCR